MTDEVNIFSSSAKTSPKRNARAEARQAEADTIERIRSSREVNPYWKDGGTGLPSEHPAHNPPPPPTASSAGTAVRMNDGGLTWWRKAYQRCTELAAAENRPLEEIAAERYGVSLILYLFSFCQLYCTVYCSQGRSYIETQGCLKEAITSLFQQRFANCHISPVTLSGFWQKI